MLLVIEIYHQVSAANWIWGYLCHPRPKKVPKKLSQRSAQKKVHVIEIYHRVSSANVSVGEKRQKPVAGTCYEVRSVKRLGCRGTLVKDAEELRCKGTSKI